MVKVVYVCSPEYWRHLFLSLRTLYASGSSFDRIKILVTANEKPNWNFESDRIDVETVPDIGNGYWYLNKTHICDIEADTVIFLDTDTMVLKPLDEVYSSTRKDLVARNAPSVNTRYFDSKEWSKLTSHFGCSDYPYLSCGFMVFQNNSHKSIKKSWVNITKSILRKEVKDQKTRFAEQEAMSIACCVKGLTLDLMKPLHHAYAMMGESHSGAVVYHLGTPNFYHYYLKVEDDMNLKNLNVPVKRPRLLRLFKFVNRVRKKIDRMRGNNRDSDVSWQGA